MQFFKKLSEIGLNHLKFEIIFNDDIATIVVIPKNTSNDDALNSIKPFSLSKTIDELDATFFEEITIPLEKTQIVFSNAMQYQARLEEQQRKTKHAKEIENSYKKLKEKLEKLIADNSLEDDATSKKASKLIVDIKAIKPKCSYTLEIENKLSQASLF